MRWGVALWTAAALLGACNASQSNAVYCTPDETMCHGSCSALYKDPANCGACDNACGATLVCSQGACATSCGGGTIQCGQSCIDTNVDRDNCGGCGKACPSDELCAEGQCASTCTATQHMCVPAAGSAYCANVTSDNQNCGACGTVCGVEQVCVESICVSSCQSFQTLCKLVNALDYCTNLMSDVSNCGSCGTSCLAGGFCVAGVCGCPASYSACDTACVDLSTDKLNCGSCGTTCTGTCARGACAVQLATPPYPASPIALDSSSVYYIDTADQLYALPKTGGKAKLLTSSASVASLAVDESYAYWPNGGEVDFVPTTGGGLTSTLMPSVDANEVVADGISVYVAYDSGIVSFPSGGGTVSPLVANEDAPHSLAVQGSFLYWADDDYTVRSSGTDGTGLTTLVTMSSAVDFVVADSVNVYFTVSGSEILAMPASGGSPPLLLVSGLVGVVRLATDGVNVYWIDSTTLSKVPVTGGAVTMLYMTGGDAADIAVDEASVFWTNSGAVMKLTPK